MSFGLIALIVPLILVFPFYAGYTSGVQVGMKMANLTYPGFNNAISWIESNTSVKDILLVTGSPRIMAWYTNRMSVGITSYEQNSATPKQINRSDIITLFNNYNATYLVVDRSIRAFPELSVIYDDFRSFLPLSEFNKVTLYKSLSSPLDVPSLHGVYKSEDNPYVLVYEIANYSLSTTNRWVEENFLQNWTVVRSSTSSDGENMVITTVDEETWGGYAHFKFAESKSIRENSYVILGVEKASEYAKAGFYLKFKDGSEMGPITFTNSGLKMISLEDWAEKSLDYILLYNLLSETTGVHTTVYDFVMLADLEIKYLGP